MINYLTAFIFMYLIASTKKDCAIFVNYHKEETISATTKYHDRFISRNEFDLLKKIVKNFTKIKKKILKFRIILI